MRRIYVEGVVPYYARLQAYIQSFDRLVVSDLSRMECRVLWLSTGNQVLLGHYETFFAPRADEIVSLTSEVVDCATEIRARYRYSVADSLHLAAAIIAQCDLFLKNDLRLTNFSEVPVATL